MPAPSRGACHPAARFTLSTLLWRKFALLVHGLQNAVGAGRGGWRVVLRHQIEVPVGAAGLRQFDFELRVPLVAIGVVEPVLEQVVAFVSASPTSRHVEKQGDVRAGRNPVAAIVGAEFEGAIVRLSRNTSQARAITRRSTVIAADSG